MTDSWLWLDRANRNKNRRIGLEKCHNWGELAQNVGAVMKKTLYIHLGPPKTGTSAIQYFLSSNDKLLSEKGSHYIKACRWDDGGHHPLAWILHYKYTNMYLNILYSTDYVARQDKLLSDLANEIDSISEESIILSSEVIPLIVDKAINDLLDYFPGMSVKA